MEEAFDGKEPKLALFWRITSRKCLQRPER
jgi:hypothetical protein